jgi:hypothetical protein
MKRELVVARRVAVRACRHPAVSLGGSDRTPRWIAFRAARSRFARGGLHLFLGHHVESAPAASERQASEAT